MQSNKFEKHVRETGNMLPAFSFPGGYPIFYMSARQHPLCAECASKIAGDIAAHDIHMEGDALFCEECGTEIASAYETPVGAMPA